MKPASVILILECAFVSAECSQAQCHQPATVYCRDCNENFCQSCVDKLHRSARGLKRHIIIPLSSRSSLHITETCPIHNMLLEFACNTCQRNVCCYCVLTSHQNHEHEQITAMVSLVYRHEVCFVFVQCCVL